MSKLTVVRSLVVSVTVLIAFGTSDAQVPPPIPEATVKLNFPNEMEVELLAEYVSQRLGIKILYDEQIRAKTITIKAPTEVPTSSLLSVLKSALKMKGLVLVEADADGWMRIVTSEELPRVATRGNADDVLRDEGAAAAVTQAFQLKHVDPTKIDELIKSFLTEPGANSVVLAESGILIVTDYAVNMKKIAEWIKLLDQPRADIVLEFVPVKNVSSEQLATQLAQLMAAKSKAQGKPEASTIEVNSDDRTNQLLLVGPQAEVASAIKIARSLDVPLGVRTASYAFENISAERIDALLQSLLDPSVASRLYRSTVDGEDNVLIVTTTDEIHRRITELKRSRDIPTRPGKSPIRFYKIKNLPVTELLTTIRGIERQSTTTAPTAQLPYGDVADGRTRPIALGDPLGTPELLAPPGTNNPPPAASPVIDLPDPPSYRGADAQAPIQQQSAANVGAFGDLPAGALLGRARITADVHTNTLIIVAEPSVQRIYAELIEKLDQRRPQVLIEAKLVIIDTSDDFSLGVEFSSGDRSGSRRTLAFSSFGLSEVDPTSGALAIIPGLGFNGTLVDPDIADVVLRALTNHRRSRVVSAPRILVNDNAEGQLSSVAEVPFTSVNASNTVATTSFAGFAEAGTTITATPRISDDNHLQLDFVITLNTFTGTGGDGVPPPRQTDEVRSQVTVPDGHTVIVGGLNRTGVSWDFTAMPFIEKVPLLRYAGGNEVKNTNSSSMFIFLRPVVLRDDKFRDLKYISSKDARCARLYPQYPTSKPLLIR